MALFCAAQRALLACVLAACAAPGVVRAQAPDTTTLRLDALLAEVEAANPTLQAARLDAAARAEVGAQVGALPDPTVGVTLFPYPLVTAMGDQRSQWRAEQMLPWPGTLALRARSADLAAEAAGYEADALALDLIFEVKRAYYELYRLQRTDTLVRQFARRLELFAEAAAVRYEVGRGPQGAVLQVQLARNELAERLLLIDRRQETALRALARLTDRRDLLRAGVVALVPPPLPLAPEGLLETALRQRPERQALDAEADRAETEVALARKAFYPELGVGVMFMDMTPRGMPMMNAGQRIAAGIGLMVSARLPLQRGRLRARLEETRLRQAQVAARRAALETQIATELDDLVYAARREAEALDLYRDHLMPQAQATVESVLAAYTTGEADYTAFLDAERARFQVGLGFEEALGRYLDATARLERALGVAALTDFAGRSATTRTLFQDFPLR